MPNPLVVTRLILPNAAASAGGGIVGGGSLTQSAIFTETDTFFTPVVTLGAQSLTQSAIFTDTDTFFTQTVAGGTLNLQPSLFTDTDTFYVPFVELLTQFLTPSLFTETDTFFTPTVAQVGGTQSLTQSTTFTETDTFYAPSVEDSDIYFDDVVLLASWNGTPGATSYTADTGQVYTFGTGQSLSSTQAKFGATSLAGGTGSGSFPMSQDWDLADNNTDQFCIEWYGYLPNLTSTIGWFNANWNFDGWMARFDSTTMEFYWNVESGSSASLTKASAGFTANVWEAYCIEKDGTGKIRFYINGTMVHSATPADSSIETLTGVLLVMGVNGTFLGDTRITKRARYASDSGYTVRTTPFPRVGNFAPRQLGNNVLKEWYDAGTAGMVTNVSGVASAIKDRSGNGNDLASSAGTRPATGTVTLDGYNVLDFDGTDDLLERSSGLDIPLSDQQLIVLAKHDAGTHGGLMYHLGASASFGTAASLGRESGNMNMHGNNTTNGNSPATAALYADSSTSWRILSGLQSTTARSIYENGLLKNSNSGTVTLPGSAGVVRIGAAISYDRTTARYLDGKIAQAFALNDLDPIHQAKIEGFLAHRHSTTVLPVLDTDHVYKTIKPRSDAALWLPSDPTVGGNLKGWFRGDKVTGSNNDPLAQFSDDSGRDNHMTQSGSSTIRPTLETAGQNGLNVVRFTAADQEYFDVPDLLSGATSGTMFVVVKAVADPAASQAASGSWQFGSEVGAAAASAYPYTDNNIYEGWGTNARKTVGNPSSSLSSTYRIIAITSAANSYIFWIDGVAFFSTGTNTVGFTSAPKFGRSQASAGVFNYADFHVAEIIFLDTVPPAWLRKRFEGYLAHKWGLAGNLASTHSYRNVAPRGLGLPFDPFWNSVKLLAPLTGTNGSTTATDLSRSRRGNATFTDSAQITTTTPVTGFSSSLVTDASPDEHIWWPLFNMQTPSLAAAVWTIEFCWKPSGSAGIVIGSTWIGAPELGFFIQAISDGSFRIFCGTYATGGFDINTTATGLWSSGTSYYMCLESTGTKIRLYMATLGTHTVATMVASTTTITNAGIGFGIGHLELGRTGFVAGMPQKMNAVRFTDGIARYGTDVTYPLPSFPFPTIGPP